MTYRTADRICWFTVGISILGFVLAVVQFCHWYAENVIKQ